MNRTQLPQPPDPASSLFLGNPGAWQRAAYAWMQQVKERIETDSEVNIRPMTPFVVTTYTAVNTMTGTDALSNVVATLIKAMESKGLTASRSAQ